MKFTILVIYQRYLPGVDATGPVTSLNALRYHLGDEFDFMTISADRDVKGRVPSVHDSVVPDTWVEGEWGCVYRISPRNQTIRGFAQVINSVKPSVLYLNSFFSPVFTLKPLLARKLRLTQVPRTVIAVRGQFSPGAIQFNSKIKLAYLAFLRMTGICEGIIWQAASDYEAKDIRRAMGRTAQQINIAPNLTSWLSGEPKNQSNRQHKSAILRVLFLSRITPKKNLLFALRVLSQISKPVEFNIVGPIGDAAYWQDCKILIRNMPDHVIVNAWNGIPHNQVSSVMIEHDLFFLPTFGENYGHVIAEALSVGTPVLIADTTPWRGLAEAGVGWDIPLEAEQEFVSMIDRVAAMDHETYIACRQRAREYARRRLTDESIIAANKILFLGNEHATVD